MFNDPSIRCYEGQWWNYLPVTIISFFIYVLSFPVLLTWVVVVAPVKQDNKVFMMRFNQLFFRFQPSKYYWECIIIFRKFIITFFVLVVSSEPILQATIALMFVVIFLFLQLYHWPYWVNECNWLETLLLAVNLGILAISLLFIGEDPKGDTFRNNNSLYNFYSGLLLAFIVVGCVATAIVACWAAFRFCFPKPKKLVSREQEAVIGTWRKLLSSRDADFDHIWKQLPREEQLNARLSAESFGYECLGIKGKLKRVSPSRLQYEDMIQKRYNSINKTKELQLQTDTELDELEEEELITIPELEVYDGSQSKIDGDQGANKLPIPSNDIILTINAEESNKNHQQIVNNRTFYPRRHRHHSHRKRRQNHQAVQNNNNNNNNNNKKATNNSKV
jgi:hypothetical protein